MTIARYLFDAGPEGAAITAANSGVAAVVNGSGASTTYAAAFANSGSFGAKFSANNTQAFARVALPNTSLVQTFTGVVTTPDVTQTTGDLNLATFNVAGASTIARLQWKQTGALVLSDTAGAHSLVIAAAGVLSLGTKYRVAIQIQGNATAGAATATAKVYTPTGTTPLGSVTSSALNMATAPQNLDLGNQGGIATQQTFGWDDVQVDSDNTAELPAYTPGTNVAPTVTASSSATTTTPNSTVPLTGTASDSDGTIASRQWAFTSVPTGVTAPTITNSTSNSASFTPTQPGVYVAQFTATDNSGASSSASVTIYVGGTTAKVIGVTANPGGWTTTPSASSAATVLGDTDSTTFVESPASPVSAATYRLRLSPLQPLTSLSMILGSAALNGTGNLGLTATLYEGSTARKTWSGLTFTGADLTLTMTAAECSTIGSWNTLDVEISAVAA
jgi:hypothetical protein